MSKRRRKDHRSHAKRRLAERYGLRVRRHELREIEQMIARINNNSGVSPDGYVLERQTRTRSLYWLRWRGTDLRVVWTRAAGGVIVTVLPIADRQPAGSPP